jgi:hypothetical protein
MNAKQGMGAAALLLMLAACGGGGASPVDAPAANEVPASATASPEAYSIYVGSLGADDRADPLSVENVIAPKSESGDPIVVN